MLIEDFITEFKAENKRYEAEIDDISIYKWVYQALRPFGQLITGLYDHLATVEGSQSMLPENFHSLSVAFKCIPKGYYMKKESCDVVQQSYMWTERTERGTQWYSCDPCCGKDEEKVITEKVYVKNHEVDFYYHKPIPLTIGKTMRRDACIANCRNMIFGDSPYEIIIRNRTLYANFDKGFVYMKYYGFPLDDEGNLTIPDLGTGELEVYVTNYVYRSFYEKLLRNKEDEHIITLFNYYVQKEREQKSKARNDLKFSYITPQSFKKLRLFNKQEMAKYDINFTI